MVVALPFRLLSWLEFDGTNIQEARKFNTEQAVVTKCCFLSLRQVSANPMTGFEPEK
jgi:hypothetical protein